ncbi:MAG: hypothetical protein ACP5HH_07225 [Fervidicoccaceae archaeon]
MYEGLSEPEVRRMVSLLRQVKKKLKDMRGISGKGEKMRMLQLVIDNLHTDYGYLRYVAEFSKEDVPEAWGEMFWGIRTARHICSSMLSKDPSIATIIDAINQFMAKMEAELKYLMGCEDICV